MWLLFAALSAVFAGLTAVLAKVGVKDVDSTAATALRTVVVLVFSWVMVLVVGSQATLREIPARSAVFLALSGLATGGSWLCYFKALQHGDINKVLPIDKSSVVLTLLLAVSLLGEGLSWGKGVGIALIAAGTFLMIEKKDVKQSGKSGKWLLFAVLSAVFASLTAILGKIGITGVESNLGTALRTCVVLVMAFAMVFITGKQGELRHISRRNLLFIVLSGVATGLSWLCYYKALQIGQAGAVASVDKMSMLISIGFAYFFFGEKLTKKAALGLALNTAGTLLMVLTA